MLVKGCTLDTWNQIKAFLFLFPSGKTYQLCILRGKIKLCKSDYKSTLWFFFFFTFSSVSLHIQEQRAHGALIIFPMPAYVGVF